jgi:hypothetical protein
MDNFTFHTAIINVMKCEMMPCPREDDWEKTSKMNFGMYKMFPVVRMLLMTYMIQFQQLSKVGQCITIE